MPIFSWLFGSDDEKAQVLTEAPVANKNLENMTKLELEALGRQYGVELDRRHTKTRLIEQLKEII
jgi:hypothetical protein